MTRALVIVTVALAAASLGANAQDHATATQSANVAAQSSVKSPQPAQQNPASSAQAAAERWRGTATGDRSKGIQNSDSALDDDSPNRTQLPQTSTILPLLGLIGLGSLLAGLFARR